MLHRKLCKTALLRVQDIRFCIGSGLTYVPPCRSILLSNIYPYLAPKSSMSTAIGSGMPITPSAGWNYLGNNRFLSHGGRLQRPISWMTCPIPENLPTHKLTLVSTSASPGRSRPTGSRIPQSGGKSHPLGNHSLTCGRGNILI